MAHQRENNMLLQEIILAPGVAWQDKWLNYPVPVLLGIEWFMQLEDLQD